MDIRYLRKPNLHLFVVDLSDEEAKELILEQENLEQDKPISSKLLNIIQGKIEGLGLDDRRKIETI